MCGACAGSPTDWAAPLVVGPRRREHVARFLDSVTRGVRVHTAVRGWRITRLTGGTTVAATLDHLVGAVAARATTGGWGALEQAAHRIEAGVRRPTDDTDDYVPPRVLDGEEREHGVGDRDARLVMTSAAGTLLHVRLAAFWLGVRVFDDTHVAMEAVDRRASFRLLAAHGHILGADPLRGTARTDLRDRPPPGSPHGRAEGVDTGRATPLKGVARRRGVA